MAGKSDFEFKRINSYIESNTALMKLLVEDCMINQLLLEQDFKDRKQIGLFGTKKNSEILGVN